MVLSTAGDDNLAAAYQMSLLRTSTVHGASVKRRASFQSDFVPPRFQIGRLSTPNSRLKVRGHKHKCLLIVAEGTFGPCVHTTYHWYIQNTAVVRSKTTLARGGVSTPSYSAFANNLNS
ncbi:hypothetical protein ACSS6W_000347 [Trichoderma asperelloides]